MSFGVDPWSDRIATATEDGPRRALLAEVSLWRASRLTDIVAARQATYAISRLHWLLRDKAAAEREARQLLSLCQTPPRASGEDMQAAKGWLSGLGATVPKVVEVRPPRERGERKKRERKPREKAPRRDVGPSKLTQAVDAGDAGSWSDGLQHARGKKGARADLVRFWLHLGRALADDDAERARRDLHRLAARIRGQLGGAEEATDAGAVPEQRPKKERAQRAKREDAPRSDKPRTEPKAEDRGPSPRQLAKKRNEALKAAMTAEAMPGVDELKPLLVEWPRLWRAIAAAERWGLDEARLERLLVAVDQAADDDRQIPGGTSLAVRHAASGSQAFRDLLLSEPTAARYGGNGIDVLIDLAAAAVAGGWEVDRVLRGPTRKESERHAVLATVGDAMNGLWRVLVRKGDSRAEIWYAADLAAEGRAGVPMLLLEEHPRVVVLPVDPDLLGWYGSLEAPDAIGWTGDEGDAVREALASL